ncbi:MAG: hypothetical protein WAT12_03585 [Candidatus Nitrotoga sp.]
MIFLVSVISVLLLGLCGYLWQRQLSLSREAYIRGFVLPKGLFEKLRQRHPHLTTKECQLVSQGLRQFFLAYHKSGRRYISMPSQVADDLWHELILYTKTYDSFCKKAFGRFLHHTPAVVLSKRQQGNEGIRRCWRYVCLEENINARMPTRLPLLFALDSKLNIPNGFRYVANCEGVHKEGKPGESSSVPYCGAELSSPTAEGGTDGQNSGSGNGDEGDGGGGDGCGGGGCGGGD